MDRQNLMKMMTQSISNVFETAFFQSVDIQTLKKYTRLESFLSGELTGACLEFTGNLEGVIYLVAPEAWAKDFTADFLGIDALSVTDAQKQDTIKEAVNMIAGHMFSFFDKNGEIHLGIPKMISNVALGQEDLLKIKGDVLQVMTEKNTLAVVTAPGA